ncbi:DPAGT1 family protein [Megaselia abdita]
MDYFTILVSAFISTCCYFTAAHIIPGFRDMFLKANLGGIDLCKKDKRKVPESLGVIVGCVFLVGMFFFIGCFYYLQQEKGFSNSDFVEFLTALLSICCMILLGFADDVLDLRWRHKLLLPTIASLPLLMVYYVNFNSTVIIMPKLVRPWIGMSLNIGFLYYIYMGALAVFCTNAINILAGINGLEVGQSIVISSSILMFNFIELTRNSEATQHAFSIYFIMPFLAASLALWKFNKYPSRVFVGDTFCYFAGMTFAVVGIIGHFSKTLLLFFIPQIFNFLYSVPQLFRFVPCPRHRLPKYDPETDLLNISTTEFNKKDLGLLGTIFVQIFKTFRLISWSEKPDGTVTTNNFTLINLVLVLRGPTHERTTTQILLGVQLCCTVVAFMIRYPLASFFYDA